MATQDIEYLNIILEPIKVCANYKPKFGQGNKEDGLTLAQFQTLYQKDPFYSWFGLDNSLMYAAHKAAGGMTSVYRQIGIGCERLFRRILMDAFGLAAADVVWSYEVALPNGKSRMLHLDGKIPLDKIVDPVKHSRFQDWMKEVGKQVGINENLATTLIGTVFEVRQGYKSKDAKRQNADIANAATAYSNAFFPCAVILSSQIDNDVLVRYRLEKWAVLTGIEGLNNPLISTYDFMRDIVGYDLADFFKQNHKVIQTEIENVLKKLLAPENP